MLEDHVNSLGVLNVILMGKQVMQNILRPSHFSGLLVKVSQ